MSSLIRDISRVAPGRNPEQALKSLLRKTEKLSAEELAAHQMAQLRLVIEYASQHTPYYRESLGKISRHEVNTGMIRSLPILTRAVLQDNSDRMTNRDVTPEMRPIGYTSTSGSTGAPLKTERPISTANIYNALRERFHDWGGRDGSKKMAYITAIHREIPKEGVHGGPWRNHPKGTSATFSLATPIEEQLEWLVKENPAYLATYPSNGIALMRLSKKRGVEIPALEDVILSSERIPDNFAEECREVWGARTTLTYSANEVGGIALGHSDHSGYLVQSESCYLEIVDDDGEPCEVGRPGRVLITTLHDGWRPLIRYEIGDYAEFGNPHEGVGHPVIDRIMGRERNLMTLPDGHQIWPIFPIDDMLKLPMRQWQFIQTSTSHLTARVVATGKLTNLQENEFRKMVNEFMPARFDVSIEYVDVIERSKSGKFEDFINQV